MQQQLSALQSIDFDWTRHLQSVWKDTPYNADNLNGRLAEELVEEALRCDQPLAFSPLGRVVVGQAGAGKTHLVGELRHLAWQRGAWFVLLDLADVNDFWTSAALGYLQSLLQPYRDGLSQGDEILLQLCAKSPKIGSAIKATFKQTSEGIGGELIKLADTIVDALYVSYPLEMPQHRRVIRAFVILQGRDREVSDIAYNWLQSIDLEGGEFGPPLPPREVVRSLSWLMSLTAPTMLVIDQIDAIIGAHVHALPRETDESGEEKQKALTIINGLARGLMDLRDTTRRTLTILSSLEATWEILKEQAIKPASARFRDPDYIGPINEGPVALNIVGQRLRAAYSKSGFTPPYPTWPFHPTAFNDALGMLPREVLKRSDAHIRRCLREKRIIELQSFGGRTDSVGKTMVPSNSLQSAFERHFASAALEDFRDPERGEERIPDLLLDALRCYAMQAELPDDVDLLVEADPHKRKPALHARLRHVYRTEGDREVHHCFRAIPHTNPIAFQSRLRAAMTAAGIDMALPFRHLVIMRRKPPPSGAKTRQMCEEFARAGGKFLSLGDDGLRVMLALQAMLKDRPEGFEAWLKARKPLCDIALFRDAGLCGGEPITSAKHKVGSEKTTAAPRQADVVARPSNGAGGPREAATIPREPPRQLPVSASTMPRAAVHIGRRLIGGEPEASRDLPLELLPRHTAILAGSGSGKTVLLRRIIEEAALLGVPSIVLDTNNDLARLGDAWPEVPSVWDETDRAKAHAYSERVESVIWTPGIGGGNPVILAPIPDFASVRDNEDELNQTVSMAHATLLPLVGATGAKGLLKEGVLAQALHQFARRGTGGLPDFVRLLSDLPPEVSDIDKAADLANDMANQIRAAVAKNPLLSANGTPLDPETLFTAAPNKVRISIINFSGLPADDAKQAFVNQLEMALFSWIKKNPSPKGRPLTGLFVVDEAQNFAPSQKNTPCKETTVALVAQARKYGLGMIFATQVPKSIDNRIISNSTTHFYGKMNSPATIDAIRELMSSKGGSGSDIASMKAGEFYFATEGMKMPEKVRTPLCLSHHPQNPLSQGEVVERARASRRIL